MIWDYKMKNLLYYIKLQTFQKEKYCLLGMQDIYTMYGDRVFTLIPPLSYSEPQQSYAILFSYLIPMTNYQYILYPVLQHLQS